MTGEFLLDMFYPRRCPVCDEPLPFGGGLICEGCREKLTFVKEPRCRICGRLLYDETKEYCKDCGDGHHVFKKAVSVFVYNDVMQRSVSRFKNGGRQEYARFYAESMWKAVGEEIRSFNAPYLIPVPIHKEKLKKRGFNQAELLARELSRISGFQLVNDLVVKVRNTAPQKSKDREERLKNVKRAFKLSGNVVKLTEAVLVDDVYTTGSTADEIARLLLCAGVKDVYVATLCSGTPL